VASKTIGFITCVCPKHVCLYSSGSIQWQGYTFLDQPAWSRLWDRSAGDLGNWVNYPKVHSSFDLTHPRSVKNSYKTLPSRRSWTKWLKHTSRGQWWPVEAPKAGESAELRRRGLLNPRYRRLAPLLATRQPKHAVLPQLSVGALALDLVVWRLLMCKTKLLGNMLTAHLLQVHEWSQPVWVPHFFIPFKRIHISYLYKWAGTWADGTLGSQKHWLLQILPQKPRARSFPTWVTGATVRATKI